MDIDQLKERIIPILKEHALPLALGLVGISFIGYGLMQSVGVQGDSSEITFESGSDFAKASSDKQHDAKQKGKEIVVDIEGAVLKPGIHKMPADSRVQDALILAGGMSEKADRLKVSRSMNLAAKVIDGGKIYIPFEGDPSTGSGQNISEGNILGATSGTLGDSTGLININTAGETELDTLSGVGPATAQKIISARPFSSVEELLSKKAVGKSVYEKIKEKVTVN